jgi:hypothetical protein
MTLGELIVDASDAALSLQQTDGSFPAGWNGPYRDPETPVRNTAHWIVTLTRAHALTGRALFLKRIERAARYLSGSEARPGGASFFCRTNPAKDACNGVIGQAWAIEALAAAASVLQSDELQALGARVFLQHRFDAERGLWHRFHVDGQEGAIDRTFNHQLWFAAAGAMLSSESHPEIGARIRRFLDRTHEVHLQVATSGRIRHRLGAESMAAAPVSAARYRPASIEQEIGYHAYNLHALALLKQRVPDVPLWTNSRLRAALAFVKRSRFVRSLEGNRYGYPYNPVGFEVGLALETFPVASARHPRPVSWWIAQQLERSYDWEARALSRGTDDPLTGAARLYEAASLRDIELAPRTRRAQRSTASTRSVSARESASTSRPIVHAKTGTRAAKVAHRARVSSARGRSSKKGSSHSSAVGQGPAPPNSVAPIASSAASPARRSR